MPRLRRLALVCILSQLFSGCLAEPASEPVAISPGLSFEACEVTDSLDFVRRSPGQSAVHGWDERANPLLMKAEISVWLCDSVQTTYQAFTNVELAIFSISNGEPPTSCASRWGAFPFVVQAVLVEDEELATALESNLKRSIEVGSIELDGSIGALELKWKSESGPGGNLTSNGPDAQRSQISSTINQDYVWPLGEELAHLKLSLTTVSQGSALAPATGSVQWPPGMAEPPTHWVGSLNVREKAPVSTNFQVYASHSCEAKT